MGKCNHVALLFVVLLHQIFLCIATTERNRLHGQSLSTLRTAADKAHLHPTLRTLPTTTPLPTSIERIDAPTTLPTIETYCEEFTVTMWDSYGDGWNGNLLYIGDFTLSLDDYLEDETYYYGYYGRRLGINRSHKSHLDYYYYYYYYYGSNVQSATTTVCLEPGVYTPYCCGGNYTDEVSWSVGGVSGGADKSCIGTAGSFTVSQAPTPAPTVTPAPTNAPTILPTSPPVSLRELFVGNITVDQPVTGDTSDASDVYGNPSNEHFYLFSPVMDDYFTFSTCGSKYDTFLRFFESDGSGVYSLDTITEVAAHDDTGAGDCTYSECTTSCCLTVVTLFMNAGETYVVLIEGYYNFNGEYRLEVHQTDQCRASSDSNTAMYRIQKMHAKPPAFMPRSKAAVGVVRELKVRGANEQVRIVNGVEAVRGETPWMVSLQTSSGFHFCGGSLISPNEVLTAAHCVESGSPSHVVIGAHNIISGDDWGVSETIDVRESWYSGSYDTTYDLSNDAAIVVLAWNSTLHTPVPFYGKPGYTEIEFPGLTDSGAALNVSGWGTLSSGGSSPDELRTVQVRAWTNAECEESYGSAAIDASMICAGDPYPGCNPGIESCVDSCQGDSGGPLFAVVEDSSQKHYIVVGIVSWGYGCASGWPGEFLVTSLLFHGLTADHRTFGSWAILNR